MALPAKLLELVAARTAGELVVANLQADGEPLPRPVPWEWHDAARLDGATAWGSRP